MKSTRVAPSTAVTCQVMIIVPANAGSSETKSTSWMIVDEASLDDVGVQLTREPAVPERRLVAAQEAATSMMSRTGEIAGARTT